MMISISLSALKLLSGISIASYAYSGSQLLLYCLRRGRDEEN